MDPIFSIYFIPDNLVKVDLGWTENHVENALSYSYWLQEWTIKAIISRVRYGSPLVHGNGVHGPRAEAIIGNHAESIDFW